ncbi:MAG: response regulator [Pseudomonadota bacterium]
MASEPNYLEKELEELIQSDPRIWRFVRETSLDGVWYWDLEDPEHEYMSPEFWKLFGFDPDQMKHLASEWQDLIYAEDLELAKANLTAHLADPEHPYDQVVRYLCADGSTAWVRCRGMAVLDDAGTPIRLLGAHNDLTALKKEERDAQATSQLLSKIMNAAQSAILGLDREGQVVSINAAGRHMLGGLNEMLPFAWPEAVRFVDGENLQPLDQSKSPLMRAMAGASLNGEVSIMSRSSGDDLRYVRVSSAPVDDNDTPVFCVIIIDDVSEQEMNRQKVERASRLDALGQLTGGIAHDFNNLLATIQYALQLAQDVPDMEKQSLYIETALKSVDRGTELIKRLLAFAKRQPGVARSQRVADLLTDFRKLATPLIEANVALDFQVKDADLWVFCNTPQLENALLNLLLNSRDAIMRAGMGDQITIIARNVSEIDADVTLRREHANSYIAKGLHAEHRADRERADGAVHRYVEFAVTDNGPGMPEEVKRRSIDPFFTTKSKNSSTGLGLSMVYGFVQQSNGELRIYSEEGQGTTVRLLLPRGTPTGTREKPVKRLPQAQGDGEVILVVEDEPSLLSMMDDLITSLGYKARTASSAAEALSRIDQDDSIDLVITDVVMPGGKGGFELARELRSRRPDLPILYMSGYTGFSETEMDAVVAPMIQKPCPPAELATAIKAAIQQP